MSKLVGTEIFPIWLHKIPGSYTGHDRAQSVKCINLFHRAESAFLEWDSAVPNAPDSASRQSRLRRRTCNKVLSSISRMTRARWTWDAAGRGGEDAKGG